MIITTQFAYFLWRHSALHDIFGMKLRDIRCWLQNQCDAIYHSNCHGLCPCQLIKQQRRQWWERKCRFIWIMLSCPCWTNDADRRQRNKQIHQPINAHSAQDDANECKAKRIQWKKKTFFPSPFQCDCRLVRKADDSVHWKNVKLFQRKTVLEWKSHEDILPFIFRIELGFVFFSTAKCTHWSQLSRRTIRNYVVLLHFHSSIWLTCLYIIPQNSTNHSKNTHAHTHTQRNRQKRHVFPIAMWCTYRR